MKLPENKPQYNQQIFSIFSFIPILSVETYPVHIISTLKFICRCDQII